MSDTVWVATIALGMAIVNMAGAVLMLWIRAAYKYSERPMNGHSGNNTTVP